jgi:EthD domain
VIKQFTFVNRRPDVPTATFVARVQDVFGGRADATPAVRPGRVALCTAVPGEGTPPRHDLVGIEWFEDVAHLARFEEWISSVAPMEGDAEMVAVAVDGHPTVVVADEVVQRGAEWFQARWRERGAKFKHMAIARRAGHLTPAEFSRRWRAHAGTVSRRAASADLVIPDDVRGLAYVQDHPLLRDDGAWDYDAINEVYFDDLEGMLRRARWFEENVGRDTQGELVGDRWFLCVREDVLRSEPFTN